MVLERCERKILLGWRLLELPNRVNENHHRPIDDNRNI